MCCGVAPGSGCVTILALYNDTAAKVTPVIDKALMEMEALTICAGCDDPRDHSQVRADAESAAHRSQRSAAPPGLNIS